VSTLWNLLIAIGSGVVGGLVGPYVTQSRERMKARAAVLEAVHRSRHVWFPIDPDPFGPPRGEYHPHVEKAIDELESLAMSGGIPRQLVERYASALTSAARAPGIEDDDWGWLLEDDKVKKELDSARRALTSSVWHPWFWPVPAFTRAMWSRLSGLHSRSRREGLPNMCANESGGAPITLHPTRPHRIGPGASRPSERFSALDVSRRHPRAPEPLPVSSPTPQREYRLSSRSC
jgi:hypothetical protein